MMIHANLQDEKTIRSANAESEREKFEKAIALKEKVNNENMIRIQRLEAAFVKNHDFAVAKVHEAQKIPLSSL
jgi:hypothetical protein